LRLSKIVLALTLTLTLVLGLGYVQIQAYGGLTCEDVLPDDECEPGDPAIEREKEITAAGGEWIDGQWFEYDPDTYWQYEDE
jgi:hypothetical protein